MNKSKIKVEFFKESGRFYDSFEYRSEIESYNKTLIKEEVITAKGFIKNMDYTIEIESLNSDGWDKLLVKI